MGVTAIVLAAGASRRFGSSKQLFEFEGEQLVRRAARVARSVAPTIVVIPAEGSGGVEAATCRSIRAALDGLDVRVVENPDAAEGMAASIRAGVGACDGDVLITVCDQPGIDGAHLQSLLDSAAPIAATSYVGTIGVPAFFAAAYREELLALRGDRGAKALFERHRDRLTTVPLPEGAEDLDSRP